MARKADYPLGRAPWARGGAGSGVVDSRSALYPTAVRAPSLVPLCVARYRRSHCRNPGAHEDANAEFGVPPHLRTDRRGALGKRTAVTYDPTRATLSRRPLRPLCLHCTLLLLLFLSLRVSTVHHPTRKGWKGVYVLALRG